MNYKESKLILKELKKAKKILINCHRGPDMDSIGSALAMNYVLKSLKKEVTLICPSEALYDDLDFLKDYGNILTAVDFNKFNFDRFDAFVSLDSGSWGMVASNKEIPMPGIPIYVIDHHHTNEKYGKINLVDSKISSTSELLFFVFKDWKIKLNNDICTSLLTGIIGDTGIFKYPNANDRTFEVAYHLIKGGADKDLIIANAYRNYDFKLIKFCGEVLRYIVLDEKYRFVYSFIPYEVYEKCGKPENSNAVDLFAQTVKGTEFGIMGIEKEKNIMSLSLRARTDFDTSLIAKELNGGGHKVASGGKLEGIKFDEAVEKVLRVARKYAKKHN